MSSSLTHCPTAIIGAGAVGQALAHALARQGIPVVAIISRTASRAEGLAHAVNARQFGSDSAALPPSVERVLICVPDDAIATVACVLVPWIKECGHDIIVAHTSGAHAAQVMHPVQEAGAQILSMHPLQTFTRSTSPTAFEGIQLTLEGDSKACAYGEALARCIGARPARIATEAKPLYHLTAVLASNGLVALLAVARHIWQEAGLDPDTVFRALQPLVETTWQNVQDHGTEALTGPAARGDAATIKTHLEALSQTEQSQLHFDVYKALTTVMVRLQQDLATSSDATPQIETMLQTYALKRCEQKER